MQNRLATSQELRAVQIIRKGEVIPAKFDMELEDGDRIITGHDISAVIILRGTELLVGPNSHIDINESSSSIFNRMGEVFIKGGWSVETKYLRAGVEGTKFIVTVHPQDRVEVVVLEGIVKVETRWGATRIKKAQQIFVTGEGLPAKSDTKEEDVKDVNQWMRDTKQILRRKINFLFWPYGIYIRRDFNSIIRYQTFYWIFNDNYADELSKLNINLSPGVEMKIISADDEHFEVEATHQKLPGYLWTMSHYREKK